MIYIKLFGWYFTARFHRPEKITAEELRKFRESGGLVCGPDETDPAYGVDREEADLQRLCAIADAAEGFVEWFDDARFMFDFPKEIAPHTQALYAAVMGFPSEPPAVSEGLGDAR